MIHTMSILCIMNEVDSDDFEFVQQPLILSLNLHLSEIPRL